jgi:hypothetical protein
LLADCALLLRLLLLLLLPLLLLPFRSKAA